MNYRNSSGGVHFGHSVVSNHESSHGVELTGGSTGGIIQGAGDDANVSVTLRGKGTGLSQVGNSSAKAVLGASTTTFSVVQRYLIQFTPAALAASTHSASTITVSGLSTDATVFFKPISPGLSGAYNFRVSNSTADELRFIQQNISASTIGTGESTSRGWLLAFAF